MSGRALAAAPGDWDSRSATLVLRGAQAGALLGRVVAARSRLTLRIGGAAQLFRSVLLAFDGHRLYLDDPYPCARALLHRDVDLQVSGELRDGHFEFGSSFEQALLFNDEPAIGVARPAQVRYDERRTNLRMAIPAGRLEPLVLEGAAGGVQLGDVVDLSLLGAGTLVDAGFAVDAGAFLSCRLSLPDTTLLAGVEVRSLAVVVHRQRLGLMFATLGKAQERELEAAMRSLRDPVIS